MSEGHEVVVLDNFFTGRKSNVEHWLHHPNFSLIRHDVIQPILLEVDQIYHLACPASPPHYQYNPVKTIKTSTMGRSRFLYCCYNSFENWRTDYFICFGTTQEPSTCWVWRNVSKHVSYWHQQVKFMETLKSILSQRWVHFYACYYIQPIRHNILYNNISVLQSHTGEMSTRWDHGHVMMRESVWLKLWCMHTRIRIMYRFVLHEFLTRLVLVCTRTMDALLGKIEEEMTFTFSWVFEKLVG